MPSPKLTTGNIWAGAKIVRLPRRQRQTLDFEPFGSKDGQWHMRPSKHCARYVLIAVVPDSRAARLAAALQGVRWVARDDAYRCLPNQAEEFQAMYQLGWDVSPLTGELRAPRYR